MKIKVAAIGPYDFVKDIIEIAQAFPELEMLPLGYTDIGQTQDLVEGCFHEVEALLFAGPIPYQIARERVSDQKTMIYLPHDGTSLYRLFFQMLRENSEFFQEKKLRLSVDIIKKEEIFKRLEELEIEVEEIYVKDYDLSATAEKEIMEFHYQLWTEQQIDAVFTCVTSVYKKLRELGVACYRIVPTKSTIHDCLQRVQLEGQSAYLADTQLAIGILHVENFSAKQASSEYEIQRKKLALQQLLIDYGEETQSLMNWTDRDEITFVTTRGVMERSTNGFSRFTLLNQIHDQLNLRVSVGVGLGRTANEAEQKAREALSKSKISGGGNCYIVMPYGNVLGPLDHHYQMEYSVRSDDEERLKWARLSGLSVGTINKMISFCETNGSWKITSVELANGFGITIRSARRLLSRLEQCKLAKLVGEEQPVSKGRPRQLYHLTFQVPDDISS
ncbi:transcriptional regulator [Ammoniphilus sp. CFH 90114]|uniref:transcriptional regulator n=1 Tax=Ammoniphilus sp. CFH 90114 TaxID=2493665 RepID=UPI00100ECE66|nr:transcriptional regulator [Ammoniphilus sp. CFH 90114]RXT07167.1 transcriptional regulator [Ammoniphilus sp. CFH 90114]